MKLLTLWCKHFRIYLIFYFHYSTFSFILIISELKSKPVHLVCSKPLVLKGPCLRTSADPDWFAVTGPGSPPDRGGARQLVPRARCVRRPHVQGSCVRPGALVSTIAADFLLMVFSPLLSVPRRWVPGLWPRAQRPPRPSALVVLWEVHGEVRVHVGRRAERSKESAPDRGALTAARAGLLRRTAAQPQGPGP